MLSLSPSEVQTKNLAFHKFDFELAKGAYESEEDRFLQIASTKYNNKVFKLILKGELTTNGVNVADFPGNPHSIGFQFTNDEDMMGMESLTDLFKNLDESWDVKELIKKDVLYLKLKLAKDKTKYAFSSDIKLDPKKPHDAPLHRHQQVEISVSVNAYFNFKENIAGISLQLLNLKTKGEEPPKKKRSV